jgi:hypothetical protein
MGAGYLFGWQAVRYLDRGSALLLLISLAAIAGLATVAPRAGVAGFSGP